jgi:hypothetical protein
MATLRARMCSLPNLFDDEEDGRTLIWSRSGKQNGD